MMKHRIMQITLLALTAALIISFVPRSGVAQEEGKVKVEWNSAINIPPAADVEKLDAFRLVNKAVGDEEFLTLSNNVLQKSIQRKAVKIEKGAVDRVDQEHLAWQDKADPSSFIMQNAVNGNLIFSNQMSKFVEMKAVSLPTKAQASQIAKDYIMDLKLQPTDFESRGELLASEGLYTMELDIGGAVVGAETQKLMTLTYGRKFNGLQVNGGGSKLVLNIGNEGKVVGFERRWNAIQDRPLLVEKGQLKPAEFKRFETKEGMIAPIKIKEIERQKVELGEIAHPGLLLKKYVTGEEVKNQIIRRMQDEWTTPDRILVNSIELVYFDRGGDWVQPAYAFQADIFWGEDVAHYLFHLAALRSAPEALVEGLFLENPHISEAASAMEEQFD